MKPATIIATLLLLTSCISSVSFVSVLDMPKGEWQSNEYAEFNFTQHDTTASHRIELIVRHTPDFEWRDLQLEIRTVNPENLFWCDTINVTLTDTVGRWLGKDMTAHVDFAVEYRRAVIFTRKGEYNIRIRRIAPSQDIEGIKAIGVIIEKDGKE